MEGSHGGAPAHLALRSSLRLVTRVNALRFCLSRLGPPPRAVVSGASHGHRGPGCVWSGFDHMLCTGGGASPVLMLIPRPSFSRSLPPSFSSAGQRSVLLPILTWRTVPRRRCRGGELTVSFGGCRWGESGFFVSVTGAQSEVLVVLSSLVHRWSTQPEKRSTRAASTSFVVWCPGGESNPYALTDSAF